MSVAWDNSCTKVLIVIFITDSWLATLLSIAVHTGSAMTMRNNYNRKKPQPRGNEASDTHCTCLVHYLGQSIKNSKWRILLTIFSLGDTVAQEDYSMNIIMSLRGRQHEYSAVV